MSGKRGGHGGAWKVAYADFVTAMMALFLVLWIVATSQEEKESIAGYFRSTALLKTKRSATGMLAPVTQVSRTQPRITPPVPTSSGDPGGEMWAYRVLAVQATLKESASTLQKLLRRNNNELTEEDAFRFEFTNDGMRIQAMDYTDDPLFEEGAADLTEHGKWALSIIAGEIERFPFRIEIEGHTHGGLTFPGETGSAWDLSTRRAIVTQQFLEKKGIRAAQFWRVAGYADRQPLDPSNPTLAVNRRITIMLRLDPNSDFDAVRRAFALP